MSLTTGHLATRSLALRKLFLYLIVLNIFIRHSGVMLWYNGLDFKRLDMSFVFEEYSRLEVVRGSTSRR